MPRTRGRVLVAEAWVERAAVTPSTAGVGRCMCGVHRWFLRRVLPVKCETTVIDRTVGQMRPHVCNPKTNAVRHAVGMEAAPQLFTIGGHDRVRRSIGRVRRSIGEFVEVLVEAGIDVLVDVRERALSRK